jgi:hypothetical protein
MKWLRYRFETYSIQDYRPLIFNPDYPYWCSGETDKTVIIVAWLPEKEALEVYWDDAINIEYTEHNSIEFTPRFPKPKGFISISNNKDHEPQPNKTALNE